MPRFRAVVFDFFGTLTRSVRRGPHHMEIARILGCDPAVMLAVLDRSFYLRASGVHGSPEECLAWVARLAGGDPSREAVRAAHDARLRAVRADTELRADAVPVLSTLKHWGMRTAVVSDCTYELPEFLPELPVAPLLDVRVFSVEEGCCKPDPAIYLAACERLGVAPDECLYVGDGGSHELTGATRVGMTALRLAAPDLSGHLVFDTDDAWRGPSVGSLTEALAWGGTSPTLVNVG